MQFTVDRVGDVAVVTVNLRQLDISNTESFKKHLEPVLAEDRYLVLDLSRVEFLDSSGCGTIIWCLKRLSAAGGDLKLCEVARPVRTVLELIRLHRVCDIHGSREEAVLAFRA